MLGLGAFAALGISAIVWQAARAERTERLENTGFHPVDAIVTIQTTPEEAEVFVDGASVGFTPILDMRMPPGRTAHLELKKKGYRTVSRDLTLSASVERLDIALISESEPHMVMHIDSEPPGASVLLGSQELGVTPMDWDTPSAIAPATLTFRLRGYVPSDLHVVRGKDTRASAKLVRNPKPADKAPPLDIKQGR
jgi:hypothetical protein